jgi:hypothetical protein
MTNARKAARTKPSANCSKPYSEMMMTILLALLEDFAAVGELDAAGPHIHELVGIAYRCGGRGKVVPAVISSLKQARRSAVAHAPAPSHP